MAASNHRASRRMSRMPPQMPPQEDKAFQDLMKKGLKKVLCRKHKNLLERKLPKNYEPEVVHHAPPPRTNAAKIHRARTRFDILDLPSIMPPHVPFADALPRLCMPDDDWATFQRLSPALQRGHLAMCRIASCLAWHEDGPHDVYLRLPNNDVGEIRILHDTVVPGNPYLPLDVEPTIEEYTHFMQRGYLRVPAFYIMVPLGDEEPDLLTGRLESESSGEHDILDDYGRLAELLLYLERDRLGECTWYEECTSPAWTEREVSLANDEFKLDILIRPKFAAELAI